MKFLVDLGLNQKNLKVISIILLFVCAASFFLIEIVNQDVGGILEILGNISGVLLIFSFLLQKIVEKKTEE